MFFFIVLYIVVFEVYWEISICFMCMEFMGGMVVLDLKVMKEVGIKF